MRGTDTINGALFFYLSICPLNRTDRRTTPCVQLGQWSTRRLQRPLLEGLMAKTAT